MEILLELGRFCEDPVLSASKYLPVTFPPSIAVAQTKAYLPILWHLKVSYIDITIMKSWLSDCPRMQTKLECVKKPLRIPVGFKLCKDLMTQDITVVLEYNLMTQVHNL